MIRDNHKPKLVHSSHEWKPSLSSALLDDSRSLKVSIHRRKPSTYSYSLGNDNGVIPRKRVVVGVRMAHVFNQLGDESGLLLTKVHLDEVERQIEARSDTRRAPDGRLTRSVFDPARMRNPRGVWAEADDVGPGRLVGRCLKTCKNSGHKRKTRFISPFVRSLCLRAQPGQIQCRW
jgi:hypothetical protein